MKSRRIISSLLLAVYMTAMALNTLVVVMCNCNACHVHAMHAACSERCHAAASMPCLSQHCECTHSHENRTTYAMTSDGDRALKLLKAVIAELPKTLVQVPYAGEVPSAERLLCRLKVPLAEDPLVSSGALRAPPVAT